MKRHLSRLWSLAAIVALLALAPASAGGQGVDGDLRVGAYTDVNETFVGGGILTRLAASQWFFNPNLEVVLVERGDLLTLNMDFHRDLASHGDTDLWLGAGLALIERSNGFGNDDTEAGLNLLAGASFLRNAAIRPYLQAKLVLEDETEGVIAFGLRF